MHHVHLIVIAEVVSDICPSKLWRLLLGLERSLEPNYARKCLRREPDLRQKTALELSRTEARAAGQFRDLEATTVQQQLTRNFPDVGAGSFTGEAPQKIVVGMANALLSK